MPKLVGRTLGPYEIIEEIGHGGMAVVYRAHDPRFNRDVAIKVLPREYVHDPKIRARFEREAQAIAALEHAAIVPVHDFGEHEGQPYLVMRYMTGGSLADRIKEGPMPLQEVARIVACLAPALDAAHKIGIIHRDIKPSNILFDQYGGAFLSDFGIVKMAEGTTQLTGESIVGTPAYIAPEMSRPGGLSPLVDIYALGVTVFQMVTGGLPYEADTPIGTLMAHAIEPIPNVHGLRPDLPQDFQTLIVRALSKDPARRYQTAGELADDLGRVVSGSAPLPGLDEELLPARGPITSPTPPDELTMDVIDTNEDMYVTSDATADEFFGMAQALTPPPSPTSALPSKRTTPARRRRVPWWVWIGGGIVGVGACVVALIGALVLTGIMAQGELEQMLTSLYQWTIGTDSYGGGSTGPSLTLNNNSGTSICIVYISPVTDQYWDTQGNRLGYNSIPASGSYTFTGFAAGDYDLRADDCSGNEVDIEWGVSITGPVTWNVP